jgi:hypothetical protein
VPAERKLLVKKPRLFQRMPSQGPGWGGPAKGMNGTKGIGHGGPARGVPGPIPTTSRRARKIANAEECMEKMTELMNQKRFPFLSLQAADKLLNRLEGLPVARNLNINADAAANLSDAELDAEIAQLEGKLAQRKPLPQPTVEEPKTIQ